MFLSKRMLLEEFVREKTIFIEIATTARYTISTNATTTSIATVTDNNIFQQDCLD